MMKKLVQVTTTIPNFVSWVIVFSLFFSIFSTQGMFNTLMINLGLLQSPTNILGNADAVWLFQTALGLWKSLGWGSIIYLAAITGIDEELYAAVKVDGAGRFRSILHVTVPGLLPTFVVLLLLSVSTILGKSFEQYFVFKNPMVLDNIEVLDLYVYRIGLTTNDYSYAVAIGILKSLVSVVLLFTANNAAKRIRGQSII